MTTREHAGRIIRRLVAIQDDKRHSPVIRQRAKGYQEALYDWLQAPRFARDQAQLFEADSAAKQNWGWACFVTGYVRGVRWAQAHLTFDEKRDGYLYNKASDQRLDLSRKRLFKGLAAGARYPCELYYGGTWHFSQWQTRKEFLAAQV